MKFAERGGFFCIGVILLATVGCTEPGETTGVAASTGGIIGAGLGAIVGNQTGNAASGMVVGAVAGAATGGLIGNAIEEQQKAIEGYDERLQRQHQVISSQRSEIHELKQVGQADSSLGVSGGYNHQATYAGGGYHLGARQPAGVKSASLGLSRSAGTSQKGRIGIVEPRLPVDSDPQVDLARDSGISGANDFQRSSEGQESARAAHDWKSTNSVISAESTLNGTIECKNAREEVQRAKVLDEPADKLFHYRRALRLCPDVAAFHNELGELYLSLDRAGDAEYEFSQALRIDPSYQPAQINLTRLSRR